jgi:hypothetical protein
VTGENSSGEVDLDRLADYVGGALDGTPDAATVAHLIATDDRWAGAHAALVAADAAVTGQLSALAARPEPMPDEVFARLTEAFAAEPPLVAQKPQLSVLTGGRHASPRRPARRRWTSVAGIAAAVAVLGGAAVVILPQLSLNTADSRSSSGAGISNAHPELATESAPAVPDSGTVRASGTDYDAAALSTLGTSARSQKEPDSTSEGGPGIKSAPSTGSNQSPRTLAGVPAPLQRLSDPTARTACLDAVVRAYQAGSVVLVDYARYQGAPALVVLLDGAYQVPDRKWVVVVGPDCGSGNAIGEQKYNAQVG